MGEKKGDSNITTVILKVDMHCKGCTSKITRHLRSLQGVNVKPEIEIGKITVTGNVDPAKLRDNLERKINKKVELISPQQLKKEENNNNNTKVNNNKSDKKKIEDKKDKETMTTEVLKVPLPCKCEGCIEKTDKTVWKTKGVKETKIDKEKETVTVKRTMDVKSLVNNLTEKLKRKVEVVPLPPKKEKKKVEEEEGNNNHNENSGQSRMQNNMVQLQHQPPYGNYNSGGYNYEPVLYNPEQFHVPMQHAQPPQMFSDEQTDQNTRDYIVVVYILFYFTFVFFFYYMR